MRTPSLLDLRLLAPGSLLAFAGSLAASSCSSSVESEVPMLPAPFDFPVPARAQQEEGADSSGSELSSDPPVASDGAGAGASERPEGAASFDGTDRSSSGADSQSADDESADGSEEPPSDPDPASTDTPATDTPGDDAPVTESCALAVSATTVALGGRYEPRNVGAIWIADASGRFVKSLEVWGNRRLSHVEAWGAATQAAGAQGNTVDAVTGATERTHRTHTVVWNCRDFNDELVPDGTYRVYFEVTESNAAGPNHFEIFEKGAVASTLESGAELASNIVLSFTP